MCFESLISRVPRYSIARSPDTYHSTLGFDPLGTQIASTPAKIITMRPRMLHLFHLRFAGHHQPELVARICEVKAAVISTHSHATNMTFSRYMNGKLSNTTQTRLGTSSLHTANQPLHTEYRPATRTSARDSARAACAYMQAIEAGVHFYEAIILPAGAVLVLSYRPQNTCTLLGLQILVLGHQRAVPTI